MLKILKITFILISTYIYNQSAFSGVAKELNDQNFESTIGSPSFSCHTKLVFFYMPNCGHCHNFLPVFKQIVREQKLYFKFYTYDITRFNQIASRFDIKGAPTLILFRSMKKFKRLENREKSSIISSLGEFTPSPFRKTTVESFNNIIKNKLLSNEKGNGLLLKTFFTFKNRFGIEEKINFCRLKKKVPSLKLININRFKNDGNIDFFFKTSKDKDNNGESYDMEEVSSLRGLGRLLSSGISSFQTDNASNSDKDINKKKFFLNKNSIYFFKPVHILNSSKLSNLNEDSLAKESTKEQEICWAEAIGTDRLRPRDILKFPSLVDFLVKRKQFSVLFTSDKEKFSSGPVDLVKEANKIKDVVLVGDNSCVSFVKKGLNKQSFLFIFLLRPKYLDLKTSYKKKLTKKYLNFILDFYNLKLKNINRVEKFTEPLFSSLYHDSQQSLKSTTFRFKDYGSDICTSYTVINESLLSYLKSSQVFTNYFYTFLKKKLKGDQLEQDKASSLKRLFSYSTFIVLDPEATNLQSLLGTKYSIYKKVKGLPDLVGVDWGKKRAGVFTMSNTKKKMVEEIIDFSLGETGDVIKDIGKFEMSKNGTKGVCPCVRDKKNEVNEKSWDRVFEEDFGSLTESIDLDEEL